MIHAILFWIALGMNLLVLSFLLQAIREHHKAARVYGELVDLYRRKLEGV